MGSCMFHNDKRRSYKPPKIQKIIIDCPICEQGYDTEEQKPLIICQNLHRICKKCYESMKIHSHLKKKSFLCPFCKQTIQQNLKATDISLNNFLQKQTQNLKKLDPTKRKIYAFACLYLPNLYNFMKKQPARQLNFQSLVIKGKMLQEYEIFEMDMIDCLPALTTLELSNNQIRSLDMNGYFREGITHLDLSHNMINGTRFLIQGYSQFKNIQAINLKNNLVEQMIDFSRFKELTTLNLTQLRNCLKLQHLNLQYNEITTIQAYLNFKSLICLRLFGNMIVSKSWQAISNSKQLTKLKLLTATITAQTINGKIQLHKQFERLEKKNLRLLVFQMFDNQPQNLKYLDQDNLAKTTFNSLSVLQINSQHYDEQLTNKKSLLYISMRNLLKQTANIIGTNVKFNFSRNKSLQISLQNIVSKIKDKNKGQVSYCYSQFLNTKILQKKVFSIKCKKIEDLVLGICQNSSRTNFLQFNLSKMTLKRQDKEQHEFKCQGDKPNLNEYVVIEVIFDLQQLKLEIFGNGKLIQDYILGQPWPSYMFYSGIFNENDEIIIVNKQVEMM